MSLPIIQTVGVLAIRGSDKETFSDLEVLLVGPGAGAAPSVTRFGFPGGKIEQKKQGLLRRKEEWESREEAARRELLEETGLTATLTPLWSDDLQENYKLVGAFYARERDIHRTSPSANIEDPWGEPVYCMVLFHAKNLEGESRGSLEGIPQWFSIHKLPENRMPNVKLAIVRYLHCLQAEECVVPLPMPAEP